MINSREVHYALDSNVLMAAHHNFYPPDVFPGFWDFMAKEFANGRISIIDRVRMEIITPPELVKWIDEASMGIIVPTNSEVVVQIYGHMADWVERNDRFLPAALDEFARGADGWLAAYASANGAVLVTNEVYDPNVRRKAPLPNLCDEFNIPYRNTIQMLRELNARFDWRTLTT